MARRLLADDERVVDQPQAGRRTAGGIHPLLLTGIAPALPMVIGSAINIWYNVTNIDPLLTPSQRAIFMQTVTVFNLTVYPIARRDLGLAPLLPPRSVPRADARRHPRSRPGASVRSAWSSTSHGGAWLWS